MRLIDADAMIKRLEEWNTKDSMDKALYNFTLCRINEQPTVEERKTGKWVLDEERSKECVENIYICSVCHNNEAWGETERTRYCSYCGAEMENWT